MLFNQSSIDVIIRLGSQLSCSLMFHLLHADLKLYGLQISKKKKKKKSFSSSNESKSIIEFLDSVKKFNNDDDISIVAITAI